MREDQHLMPPPEDLDWALKVEAEAKRFPETWASYTAWLNNKPISERYTPRELRDGCILTGLYVRYPQTGDSTHD